ncbi:hypothetical protein NG895_18990 [Aeoliella sp. ICT_H6.2]|uniref:Lipoprotein n=1 Tax=Aeoliella straminimaris TaxID=2954799 RepID=A0A9X2FBT1_9BACT|nr:hypothetical protein [Aeoliella straminimaris]MCO6045990.1 hypothetical protein [Aeoliella straminimaris]
MHRIIVIPAILAVLGCFSDNKNEQSAMKNKGESFEGSDLPNGYFAIDESRDSELNTVPFNSAIDGMESESTFTDKFAAEIADTMNRFSNFFSTHGAFGSLERYDKELPSDWWIDDDFYSTSRVLAVDILNPNLQTYAIIEGIREELRQLDEDWMILMHHDNDFDALGNFVERPGSYRIWIRTDRVEIYAERPEDVDNLMNSLPGENRG